MAFACRVNHCVSLRVKRLRNTRYTHPAIASNNASEKQPQISHALPQVSLDLASFEVVRHAWSTLQSILAESLLHTVFANEEEAAAVLEQSQAVASPVAADNAGDGCEDGGYRGGGCHGGAQEGSPATAAASGHAQPDGVHEAAGGSPAAAATCADGCRRAVAEHGDGSVSGESEATAAAAGPAQPAPPPASPAEQELLGDATVAAAQRWLLRHCKVAVVSLGSKGCVARAADGSAAACTASRFVALYHDSCYVS